MLSYFIVNLFLTGIILLYLFLLKTSPYRIRFRLTMVALISWLVPYEMIMEFINPPDYISLSYIEEISRNLNTGSPLIPGMNGKLSVSNIMFSMMSFGIILLISDVIKLRRKIKNTEVNSEFINKTGVACVFKIRNSDDVFVTGFIHPRIYIGDELLNSKYSDTILTHEIQHIDNHDSMWLVLITLIQRLFWWNPIVLLMVTKARKYIELSCDSICKNKFGSNLYQQQLAEILLFKHERNKVFELSIFSDENFNIFRIKQLSREFKMDKKNKLLLITTLLIPLFLLSLSVSTSTASSDKTNNKNPNHILADDEVDMTFEIKLQKNPPNQNNDVKTQSIKSRMIFKFGTPALLKASEIDMEIKITPQRVNDNEIYLETEISFMNLGEKINTTPTLLVKNNTKAQINLNDDTYNLEFNVLPVFNES